MASIQYTGVVAQIKGSIAGTTFQSNRNGFTVRAKPIPRNKRSTRQQIVRTINAGLSQKWRTLLPADRTSWELVAPSWPAVDRFGNPVVLSGYSVYLRANTGLVLVGSGTSDVGLLPAVLQPLSSPVMAISAGGGTAVWSWTGGALDPDMVNTLSCTRMMSQGRGYQKTGFQGLIRVYTPTASGVDVWPELIAFLGQTPIVGSLIWFEMRVYSEVSGNVSAPFPFSCIVGA